MNSPAQPTPILGHGTVLARTADLADWQPGGRVTDAGVQAAYAAGRAAGMEEAARAAEAYDHDGMYATALPKGWGGCRRSIAAHIRRLVTDPGYPVKFRK